MVSRTVLLMITPYSQPRLEGISRFARAHGWNLMMEDRLLPDEDPRQYDGVLMTLRDAPEAVSAARRLLLLSRKASILSRILLSLMQAA